MRENAMLHDNLDKLMNLPYIWKEVGNSSYQEAEKLRQ